MKKTILLGLVAIAIASFTYGCGEATVNETQGKGDTAALVHDSDNTLQANPVNDTAVAIPDSVRR